MAKLTKEDIEMLLISLSYTYRAFNEYTGYPSYEFKQQRLAEVDDVRGKLWEIKKELKHASKSKPNRSK